MTLKVIIRFNKCVQIKLVTLFGNLLWGVTHVKNEEHKWSVLALKSRLFSTWILPLVLVKIPSWGMVLKILRCLKFITLVNL